MNDTQVPDAMNPQPAKTSAYKWREVILFVLLAYLLSWIWWGIFLLPGTPASSPTEKGVEQSQMTQMLMAIGDFGPLVAALIMRLLISKEGLKGTMGWRRSWKYYLLAILAPIIFFGLLAVFNHATGLGRFQWNNAETSLITYLSRDLLIGAIFITLFVLGEEYGWRGYLLPRALALGEVKGTLLVGLVWGLWHLPLLLTGISFPGQSPLLTIPIFTLATICLSFPFTWFYKATIGSVVLASIFHGFINAYGDGLTATEVVPEGNQLLIGSGGLVMSAALLILIVLVYTLRQRQVK